MAWTSAGVPVADWLDQLRAEGERATKLANDLEFFASERLKIRPKAGSLAPFIFNPAQRELHRRLEERRYRGTKENNVKHIRTFGLVAAVALASQALPAHAEDTLKLAIGAPHGLGIFPHPQRRAVLPDLANFPGVGSADAL